MARPRNASPARNIHVALPGDIWPRLELHLYSEAERRVPFAAYQRFLVERIREFFGRATLDVAPYFTEIPHDSYVYGPRPVIEMLKKALEEQ